MHGGCAAIGVDPGRPEWNLVLTGVTGATDAGERPGLLIELRISFLDILLKSSALYVVSVGAKAVFLIIVRYVDHHGAIPRHQYAIRQEGDF